MSLLDISGIEGIDISDKHDEMSCLSGWNDVAGLSDQYDSMSCLSCCFVTSSDENAKAGLHGQISPSYFLNIIAVPIAMAKRQSTMKGD